MTNDSFFDESLFYAQLKFHFSKQSKIHVWTKKIN